MGVQARKIFVLPNPFGSTRLYTGKPKGFYFTDMIIKAVSNGSSQLHVYRDGFDNVVLTIEVDGIDEDLYFVFESTSDAVYFADQLKSVAQQTASEANSPKK